MSSPNKSINFERLALALEATAGTKIANPTHVIPVTSATMTPQQSRYAPSEMRGGFSRNFRQEITRAWGQWEADMPADTRILPLLFNMAVKDVSTGTGAGTHKTWAFPFDETSSTVKTATMWFGSANFWQNRGYSTIESLEFTNSADSEDAATVKVSGFGNTAALGTTAPTIPAISTGSLLPPGMMAMWLDTSSAIGTTAIANRLISATHKITTGYTEGGMKFWPLGTDGATNRGYSALARDAASMRLETTITLEIPDLTQIALWEAATFTKLRIRHYGKLIATTEYHYVDFDTYGPLEDLQWGTYAGTNRVVTFTVKSHYDATLAAQARVAVQNESAAL
jgi:hypothetical protein